MGRYLLNRINTASHLTHENLHYLKERDYVVGPKADGERMLLIRGGGKNNHLYLISPAQLHSAKKTFFGYFDFKNNKEFLIQNGVELEGSYNGDVGNFVLDTEVVTVGTPSYQLVLAFDIVDFNQQGGRGGRGGSNIKDSYIQRHKTLRKIVEKMSTPGLFVKSIVSANNAYNMWKDHWSNPPYKTDGLVFTPVFYNDYPILKWKPSNELSIDVAIGGPQERGQTHTRFQAYLYDEDSYFIPPKTIIDTVKACHWGFHTDPWAFPATFLRRNVTGEYEGAFDADILDTDRKDRIAIANDRMDESTEWLKNRSCSMKSCCCGEELPVANRKIMHCTKCGILGVADAEIEFVCKSKCCLNQGKFGVTDTDSAMNICIVMVPNDCVELAKHGIVEVIPRFVDDWGNFELCFKRVRKDLQRANTFSVANKTLDPNRRNVSLEDVQFKNSALISEMNVELFQFKEEEMSRLYAAAVFKTQNSRQEDVYLVNPAFPSLLERGFLMYLPIPDLVRCRKISKLWKHTIDEVEILPNTKDTYFSQPNKIAQYDEITSSYMMKGLSSTMNASALAQYYKFGGSACEVVEDEDENENSDCSNASDPYYSDDNIYDAPWEFDY